MLKDEIYYPEEDNNRQIRTINYPPNKWEWDLFGPNTIKLLVPFDLSRLQRFILWFFLNSRFKRL